MPAGRIHKQFDSQGKKRVLSNKALTKRVRGLSNQEGEREWGASQLLADVSHTAGTGQIKYFDDSGMFLTDANHIQHYYDCWLKLTSVADSTFRFIYLFDESFNDTNLTVAGILHLVTNSASPYDGGSVTTLKEARNKNRTGEVRAVIVKDFVVALNAGESKIMKFRLPMFNRRSYKTTGINTANFLPLIMTLCDENTVIVNLGVNYVRTNLDN